MGIPQSISTERRATKVTAFYSVDELRALHARWGELVAPDHVVFEDNFTAFCLWSCICNKPQTAQVLFRAFDAQHRGYVDFEDFCMAVGAITRGTTDQLSEVLFRMIGPHHQVYHQQQQHDGDDGDDGAEKKNEHHQQQQGHTNNNNVAIVTAQHNERMTPPRSVYDGTPVSPGGGPTESSPYRTADGTVVRYDDVVQALQGLDATFLCLRCDGGLSAQSVAARLPFDEAGNLNFADLKKRVEQRL